MEENELMRMPKNNSNVKGWSINLQRVINQQEWNTTENKIDDNSNIDQLKISASKYHFRSMHHKEIMKVVNNKNSLKDGMVR